MTFRDLVEALRSYSRGEVPLEVVLERLGPVLSADPLDVTASDATPWDSEPAEQRLFWRLVYLLESGGGDERALRELATRVVGCLDDTGSPATTHDLLPLLADQSRLCTIIDRHARGVISRTGFLSVVAESGYPPHVKLWLEHASPGALSRLRARLERAQYEALVTSFDSRPG